MPSIQQLMNEVAAIRRSSQELSQRVGAGNAALNSHAMEIATLVRGSRSGADAVTAVRNAAKSLSDASASMITLSITCDNCIADLAK